MAYTSEEKAAWNAKRADLPEAENLREEFETGKPNKRRQIDIPPPREPEVNPDVYRDVVPLLHRGFLTQVAEINDVLFVFKNLNHHEFEMVKLIGGYVVDREPPQRFWDLFLAYGVFMVDGQNLLLDRDRFIHEIAKTFSVFPREAKLKVIRHLSELNRRASVATTLTEAYATESYSRYRWSQVTGIDLMSSTLTGISGTDRLGLNYAQLTWRSINYFEDLAAQIERDWENAKFIGSCFVGKGIQKIYDQDNSRRRKHREDIVARKDAILRHALFGESPTDAKQAGHATVIQAKTTEELALQLQKSLRGEKDWHDTIIEAHERNVRETRAQQEAQIQSLVEAHRQEFGDLSVVGGTDHDTPLSPAEVAEHIQRRKQLQAQQVHKSMTFPLLDEKLSKHHHKWGLDAPVEVKVGTTDDDVSNVAPLPSRTPGRPFRR